MTSPTTTTIRTNASTSDVSPAMPAGWRTTVPARSIAVTVAALVITVVSGTVAMVVGDFPLPVSDVIGALRGQEVEGRGAYVVLSLRLPRVVVGALVGAALGLSGAIFQRLARNPLASPDIIGINAGAATAAVIAIVVFAAGPVGLALSALAGSAGTAVLIYVLAWRDGLTTYRLILVGIGVAAALGSVVSYLLTRSDLYTARNAGIWLVGSLAGRSSTHVLTAAVTLAVLLPVAVGLARSLRILELGDDAAIGLGVRVEAARRGLLLTGVGLAAFSVAVAGPVGFVALVAPQIARRLTRAQGLALVPAAACGAALVVTADLVARRIVAPTELPVGLVTAMVGAPYFVLLLVRANRIGRGG